jgi:hypothetical protein
MEEKRCKDAIGSLIPDIFDGGASMTQNSQSGRSALQGRNSQPLS